MTKKEAAKSTSVLMATREKSKMYKLGILRRSKLPKKKTNTYMNHQA